MSARYAHQLAAYFSIAVGAGVALAQPTGVTGYELISIGVAPGRDSSSVEGLDDFGRVLGRSGSPFSTPVVWVNGELLIVPTPEGYERPLMSGIGDGGVVVGSATLIGGGLLFHPFVWTASQGVHQLELLPGMSRGNAHSPDNQPWPLTLTGGYCNAGADYATMWSGTRATQMGGPGSSMGPINIYGNAVGVVLNQTGVSRPVLWRDGQMIDIGGEPIDQSGGASGINDFDEIVGELGVPRRAFYWSDGERTMLPDIYSCGGAIHARAINNDGLVVGQAGAADCGRFHAAVWDRRQALRGFIIDEFAPRHPDLDLYSAEDINNAGQIAAYGENVDGDGRGYLVTPYLFEMTDPVPGRAGTQNTITVTGLEPNQRLLLVWGMDEGAQKIRAACPGGTLLIRDPHALPMVRADENGIATITAYVPFIARGRTIRMQAIAPFECQISHTVTFMFE